MTIAFRCQDCDRTYEVDEALLGKQVRCRECGRVDRLARPPARDPVPGEQGRVGALRWAILEESRVQGLASGLLVLGAIDLYLTFTLLRRSPAFFEANPVAHWFFARWNMAGMVLFKFAVLGFAIAASELIERRRPGWGKFVLAVGCFGTLYAIHKGYTLHLVGEPAP